MPIVTLELVSDDPAPPAERVQALADALGELFGSPPGATWLRIRTVNRSHYAENGARGDAPQPVFVEVLERSVPPHDDLAERTRQIAAVVAAQLDRPVENVHVIYAPPGAGRVAFGGDLLPP